MATAGKQDKLNIQIKSIKTAMSTMFTQIDDIYRSNHSHKKHIVWKHGPF